MRVNEFKKGITFDQWKSLIETDFFDVEQIVAIMTALEKGVNPVMKLSDDQLMQLARMVQMEK